MQLQVTHTNTVFAQLPEFQPRRRSLPTS